MKSFLTKLVLQLAFLGGVQLLCAPIFVSTFSLTAFELAALELTAQAAELSEIQDRGYITIGVKNNRAPLGFIDSEGNLTGFEIDIAERLAETLLGDRTAVRLIPVANVNRLNALIDGEVDIVIAALTITEARRRLINYSDPYYLDGAAFITQNSDLQTLRDLNLANIAVLEGSSTIPQVQYILPGASLLTVSSYQDAQTLLNQGAADAFAGDVSVLAGWLNRASNTETSPSIPQRAEAFDASSYRLLPSIISAEPLAIAIPKGTRYNPLTEEINQALRQWYAEGWLQERAAFWGLPSETTQFTNLAPQTQVTEETAPTE